MFSFAAFIAASIAILWLSWRSLRSLRAHGFYRFFAFELLAGLISVNIPVWFRNPWSARQIASYLLGTISIALAAEGFRLLLKFGKPSPATVQGSNLAFENTTHLVTAGTYGFIRHPLYASLLALAGCAWLKAPLSSANIAMTLGTAGLLLATALAEERENLDRFGAKYADYMRHTRRFVPFLF
jgi:protein-S-isoprenylcysteine O-methyltransferase Ste14